MMKKILAAALLTFLSLSVNAAAIDGAAPNFKLKTLDGKAVKLSALKGKVVMINFWASWCGPCKLSLPALEELRQELKSGDDAERFEILAVNLDSNPALGRRFLERHPVSYPVLSNPDGSIAESWALPAMPTSYLIAPDGRVSQVHSGYRDGDQARLRTLLLDSLKDTP